MRLFRKDVVDQLFDSPHLNIGGFLLVRGDRFGCCRWRFSGWSVCGAHCESFLVKAKGLVVGLHRAFVAHALAPAGIVFGSRRLT